MNPVHAHTIATGDPFARTLAGWLLEQYGADISLTRVLVLLPNRRACLVLREAFLECTGGKPLLLPRIQPIGDLDQEELLWADIQPVPPPISPLWRQLLLTNLVMRFERDPEKGRGEQPQQAAELARQLARLIDDVTREELDFDRLSTLVSEDFQLHWQQTLEFLKLVSHHWPLILEKENAVDPAAHRHCQLKAIAIAWKKSPPNFPVIAAGSTGSQPATAALLGVIAQLPQGRVILPGFDTGMPEEEWKLLTETHPQHGLKQLLERIGCGRSEVTPLAQSKDNPSLRAIFHPPEITAGWAKAASVADGLKHIQLISANTLLDEARMIAIALRETLETSGKTAALVTPDRKLARMVATQMQRFGIAIDDSAGQKLLDSPAGCFLRLAIDMVASAAAPVELLALLRHPLAACGMEPAECRRLSRILETELLRGVRREPGIKALENAARAYPGLQKMLKNIREHMQPLTDCFRRQQLPLRELLEKHLAFAEWMAGEALWTGETGNRLAEFFSNLLQHADLLSAITPSSYPGLLESLLAEEQWWPRHGLHPRLHILSPMEARMQRFDRVILGSLNEGTWPALPEADPWMSRPMRLAFGLPAPERSLGQSAHDFFLLCASPEVVLSRARKVDGVPTVPSRWLVRLETLIGKDKNALESMRRDTQYEAGIAQLDAPLVMAPLIPPAPVPPLEARPRELRVTAVDNWVRDPYMIYARYILGLQALDPLDEDPGAADFGNLVHKSLEQFAKRWPEQLPDNPLEHLLECGHTVFAEFIDRPAVASLWWPRFESMAGWVIEQEKSRRAGARILGEVKGRWEFDVDGRKFTLTTSIDRIELHRDGAVIADYKTGVIPEKSDIAEGLANQLPLEALIAIHGMLDPAQQRKINVTALEYWKLAGADKCEIRSVETDLTQAQERLVELVRRFDKASEPYRAQTDKSLLPRYNDYGHLTRRQEWEAV